MEIPKQRNYWGVRLGRGNEHAEICRRRNLITVGWNDSGDLNKYSTLDQKEFIERVGGLLSDLRDEKSIRSNQGSARQLYKFAFLMKPGDIVMSPANSEGLKYFGVIKGDYYYTESDSELNHRHRRDIEWISEIDKSKFSEQLRNSSGALMTLFNLSSHAEEIERLLGSSSANIAGEHIENAAEFGLEGQLEDFLIHNWKSLEFAKQYDIYKEEDEEVGQQYPTDVGRIDILARSKDKKSWLVIELKKGRSGDAVVGQLLRYIGYIVRHLASENEKVRGLIITGEDDKNIRYAISQLKDIDFMTYSVKFDLKLQKL